MTWAANSVTRLGDFIALWATFQRLWQQLFCPNCPHFWGNFVMVSNYFIFLVKSFLGNFSRHLATLYWSHCLLTKVSCNPVWDDLIINLSNPTINYFYDSRLHKFSSCLLQKLKRNLQTGAETIYSPWHQVTSSDKVFAQFPSHLSVSVTWRTQLCQMERNCSKICLANYGSKMKTLIKFTSLDVRQGPGQTQVSFIFDLHMFHYFLLKVSSYNDLFFIPFISMLARLAGWLAGWLACCLTICVTTDIDVSFSCGLRPDHEMSILDILLLYPFHKN